MSIAELEDEVERLHRELGIAKERLRTARIAASGIELGSIVRNNEGKRFRVTEIDTTWTPPWVRGNPERADGTFGTAVRNLYENWTKESGS